MLQCRRCRPEALAILTASKEQVRKAPSCTQLQPEDSICRLARDRAMDQAEQKELRAPWPAPISAMASRAAATETGAAMAGAAEFQPADLVPSKWYTVARRFRRRTRDQRRLR